MVQPSKAKIERFIPFEKPIVLGINGHESPAHFLLRLPRRPDRRGDQHAAESLALTVDRYSESAEQISTHCAIGDGAKPQLSENLRADRYRQR